MRILSRILRPRLEASAHCDLPCGVYDPAQARIEAESVKAIQEKYQGNDDVDFRTRAVEIKEQRSDLVKHHLWVLWTDYFKPPHFEKYPELHELFNKATKAAAAAPTARSRPTTRPPARRCSTSSRRSTRSSGRRRPLPSPGPTPTPTSDQLVGVGVSGWFGRRRRALASPRGDGSP